MTDGVSRPGHDGAPTHRTAPHGRTHGTDPMQAPESGGPHAGAERRGELTYVCEHGMHGKCRSYVPAPGMPKPPPWPLRCPCECHRPTGQA